MLLAIYSLMFGSMAIVGLASYPPMLARIKDYLTRRTSEATIQLEDMFMSLSQRKLTRFHLVAPLVLGGLLWAATQNWLVGVAGLGLGVPVPKLMLRFMKVKRDKKFHAQLVDCLLLLSSCLRAGLSIQQSFGVVAEEMPAPISQEFGLVLKESRMGMNLDEVMQHFKQRYPSDDVNLFVTAVLVARETGGDITAIFTRLVETLRERTKIRERIKTLTFMARMQAVIMAILPVAFSFVVYSIDPSHFKFFITDSTGKVLLAGVVMVQLFGAYLFLRFSRSPL